MTTTPDADVDLSVIEHLDFDPVLPCEYSHHAKFHVPDDPAAFVVDGGCLQCGDKRRFLMCRSGWDDMCSAVIFCETCGAVGPRDVFLKIVAEI